MRLRTLITVIVRVKPGAKRSEVLECTLDEERQSIHMIIKIKEEPQDG